MFTSISNKIIISSQILWKKTKVIKWEKYMIYCFWMCNGYIMAFSINDVKKIKEYIIRYIGVVIF